jgi:hypothetical protein
VWDRRRNLDQILELFPLLADGGIAPGGVADTGGELPPLIRSTEGINQLPTSLLVHIFENIEVKWASPRLPLVCRDWSTALRSGWLWKQWFCLFYPLPPSSLAALAAPILSPTALGRKISDGAAGASQAAIGLGEVDEEGSDGVEWRTTYRDRSLIAQWCIKYPRIAVPAALSASGGLSPDEYPRPRSPQRGTSGDSSSNRPRERAGSGGGRVGSPSRYGTNANSSSSSSGSGMVGVGSPARSEGLVGSPPRTSTTTTGGTATAPPVIAGNMDFVMRETEGKRDRGSRDRRNRENRDTNTTSTASSAASTTTTATTTGSNSDSKRSVPMEIKIPAGVGLSSRDRAGSGGYEPDTGPPSPPSGATSSNRFSPPVRSTSSYSLNTPPYGAVAAGTSPPPMASSVGLSSSSTTSGTSGSVSSGLTGALAHSVSTAQLSYVPLVLRGHRAPVTCIRFDRTKLAYAADKFIRIFSLSTGRSLGNIKGNFGDVTCLDFSTHVMVSGSTDRAIRSYDWDTMELKRATAKRNGHRDTVTCVKLISNSDQMVSAALDGMIKTWDTDQGQCLRTFNDGDNDGVGGICAMDSLSENVCSNSYTG